MKYLIFSDENGKWNEGEYYIRSWIKVTPEKYDLIRKEIYFSKHETAIKELKWANFKSNYNGCKSIFSVPFEIFITISKPEHFQRKRYNIIDSIESVPISTGGQALTDKIKRKIINSTKNELFFNYFEKHHIENSKNALLSDENSNDFKYIIDTPQYLDRSWSELAKECGIEQLEIEKTSKDNPGVELADIVCGCMAGLLKNDEDTKIIYRECIKEKMLNMLSKKIPNPNLIFYGDFISSDKKKMDVFR